PSRHALVLRSIQISSHRLLPRRPMGWRRRQKSPAITGCHWSRPPPREAPALSNRTQLSPPTVLVPLVGLCRAQPLYRRVARPASAPRSGRLARSVCLRHAAPRLEIPRLITTRQKQHRLFPYARTCAVLSLDHLIRPQQHISRNRQADLFSGF